MASCVTPIFREGLMPPVLRSYFRKSVAMVEEPDIALGHFGQPSFGARPPQIAIEGGCGSSD